MSDLDRGWPGLAEAGWSWPGMAGWSLDKNDVPTEFLMMLRLQTDSFGMAWERAKSRGRIED